MKEHLDVADQGEYAEEKDRAAEEISYLARLGVTFWQTSLVDWPAGVMRVTMNGRLGGEGLRKRS